MSDHAEAFFYSKNHRKIQERFSAVGLADGALRYNVRAFLDPEKREIIQNCSWAAVSTILPSGFPHVSIKAGSKGFCRVTSDRCFDFDLEMGNGMMLLWGNIENCQKISFVFIDPISGAKVTVIGNASCSQAADERMETNILGRVFVKVVFAWENCPRFKSQIFEGRDRDYNHAHFPTWKRLDILQEYLLKTDQHKASSLGLLTPSEYRKIVKNGGGDHEY